jgi:hypothetical protein
MLYTSSFRIIKKIILITNNLKIKLFASFIK